MSQSNKNTQSTSNNVVGRRDIDNNTEIFRAVQEAILESSEFAPKNTAVQYKKRQDEWIVSIYAR